MKLTNKEFLYILFILILCIFIFKVYSPYTHCDKPGGAVHPECLSPLVAQKFKYGTLRY